MINKQNYATEIKRFDIDRFPPAIKKSYDFVEKNTKGGTDWAMYDKSEPIRKMIDLYFEKLDALDRKQEEHVKTHIIHARIPDHHAPNPEKTEQRNAMIYGKGPGDKTFSAMDWAKSAPAANLMHATLIVPEKFEDAKRVMQNTADKNPGWKFELRDTKTGNVHFETTDEPAAEEDDEPGYIVFNDTDGFTASRDSFKTEEDARKFIKDFPERFRAQGYYRTGNMEKISPDDVVLTVIDPQGNRLPNPPKERWNAKDVKVVTTDSTPYTENSAIKEFLHHMEDEALYRDAVLVMVNDGRKATADFLKSQPYWSQSSKGRGSVEKTTKGLVYRSGKSKKEHTIKWTEVVAWIEKMSGAPPKEETTSKKTHAKPATQKKAGKEQPGKVYLVENEDGGPDHEYTEERLIDEAAGESYYDAADAGEGEISNVKDAILWFNTTDRYVKIKGGKTFPAKKAKATKEPKKTKFSDAVPIERESDSVRGIRRYVNLHNKVKTRDQLMSLLDWLQKAISERRINKNDPHAKEITRMQSELRKTVNSMAKNKISKDTIELGDDELARLTAIAYSEKSMVSIAWLKRYISLDGKKGVKDKAKKLIADIEKAIVNGKFDDTDKYFKEVSAAHTNLLQYVKGKTETLEVWTAELNGFREIMQASGRTIVSAGKYVKEKTKNLVEKVKPHVTNAGIKFIVAKLKGAGEKAIQSITFNTNLWSLQRAHDWLLNNGYTDLKRPESTARYYRYVQRPASEFVKGSFKTITPGTKEAEGLGFIFPAIAAAATSALVTHALKPKEKDKEELDGCACSGGMNGDQHESLCARYIPEKKVINPIWDSRSEVNLNGADDDGIFKGISDLKSGGHFMLNGDFGILLGKMERKELAITLEGDEGSGKTQFAFQLADAFADSGLKVGIFELEKDPDSENIKQYRDMYIKPSNIPNIQITGRAPRGLETIRKYAGQFDVIMIDSWTSLDVDSIEFGNLRKQFPKTVFVAIFQRRPDKIIRGGTQPLYDSDINLKATKVDSTFLNNYVEATKNRYAPTGLRYNISYKTIVQSQ